MRLDYPRLLPDAVAALGRLEPVVRDSGLDPRLPELVKVRVSQDQRLRTLSRDAHGPRHSNLTSSGYERAVADL